MVNQVARKMAPAATTDRPAFDYAMFVSLTDDELVAYTEHFANEPESRVSPERITALADNYARYDECHRVYALELGADRDPARFAPLAVEALSDREQSVRLAAHRVLSRLPVELIDDKFILDCEASVRRGTHREVADLPERLRKRRLTPPPAPPATPVR